jgi:hypothetical protein
MQTINMNYLSPAQSYADNNNKYSNLKPSINSTMEGHPNDYDNYMNRTTYIQKSKPIMNNNLLRMMNNPTNGNNYDDYHYDNISFSQTSNSIPSPSFSQYQNPMQNTSKFNNTIHHNRSNPYEYNMNTGDYSFEEYLRETKIKRSRSDNTNEYTMNMNSNPSTMLHPNYCPTEYNHNKSLINNPMNRFPTNGYNNYPSYPQASNHYNTTMSSYNNSNNNNNNNSNITNNNNINPSNSSSNNNYVNGNGNVIINSNVNVNVYANINHYNEEAYDEMVKQKYGYDFSNIRTATADMSGLYRNMLNVIQQDPVNKSMMPERYGMKYSNYGNPTEIEGSQMKKPLMNSNAKWNTSMYHTPAVHNVNSNANANINYINGNFTGDKNFKNSNGTANMDQNINTNVNINTTNVSVNVNTSANPNINANPNNNGNANIHINGNGNANVVAMNQNHPYSPFIQCSNESNSTNAKEKELLSHGNGNSNESSNTVNTSTTEKTTYSKERADELFVFYISFLRKELYKNVKKMDPSSPNLKGSDTQSSISTPANEETPLPITSSKSNAIFSNNTISNASAIPSIGNTASQISNNNSSQSSYMTSQSDPYYSPPCSPSDGRNMDVHNMDVKYCIHLILNKGKIESYINLPNECILCHHSCHMETVVETVAEIYSNRFCSNSHAQCRYCLEHDCKKKCAEFNKNRVINEDVAIDLETVETFMNKYSPGGDDAHNASIMTADDSDVQTLNGNTSVMSTLKGDYSIRHSSVYSNKLQANNNTSFSDKRSESSCTLMDQSTSFENDLSRFSSRKSSSVFDGSEIAGRSSHKSTMYDGEISRQFSRKSTVYDGELSRQSSRKSTVYDGELSRQSSRKSTVYDGELSRQSSRKSTVYDGELSRQSSRKSSVYDGELSRQSSRKSSVYDGELSRQSSRKSSLYDADTRLTKSNSSKSSKSVDLHHQRSMNETFLKSYNLYGNENSSATHALKTPGESIIDDSANRTKIEISKSDSRNNFDPTGQDSSLELESKPANTSTTSTSSYQEAVANTSTTAKNMAKMIEENTSFENRKSYEKYDKHDSKGDPKTLKRLRDAEENRRKVKEKIGYERKVLSFLESHGGEVTDPEDIRKLTDLFVKEFSFYGFILRFSMVFAIICAMLSEHSRHISYNVDSFINISKIVVFVIVKNITPITSCISALILYVRFIETMDYETAGDRYKIVRHFSELVRDEEFGRCVDKILGGYLEKVNSGNGNDNNGSSSSTSNNNNHNNNNNNNNNDNVFTTTFSSSTNTMEEDRMGSNNNDKMDLDRQHQLMDEIAHMNFRSKRQINSDFPIFPSSSMNERNRNVVIDSYLLFIMCLIISHKYTIDTCEYNYKNKSWYFIYTFFLKDYKNPNMTMKQFNQYEFYILCVLQYNIHISMEEYNNFDIFVKRNCSSFGKDLSLYITSNVLEKLSKAMVHQEYYKKLNSNNYKNYIFNSVINNMESKIRVFFEQVIAMVKRNTNEYNRKYCHSISA